MHGHDQFYGQIDIVINNNLLESDYYTSQIHLLLVENEHM